MLHIHIILFHITMTVTGIALLAGGGDGVAMIDVQPMGMDCI